MKHKVEDLNAENSAIFKKWSVEVSPELSLDDAEEKLTKLLNVFAYHEMTYGTPLKRSAGFELSADIERFRIVKQNLELNRSQNWRLP